MKELTEEDSRRTTGCVVVANISGGKDSAALSLFLKEAGIEHVRVFADTGWEHASTYEYLRGPLTDVLGPIHEVRPVDQFVQLTRKRKTFASHRKRFCTEKLKVEPIYDWMRSEYPDDDVVNAVGIRREESNDRRWARRWEYSETLDADVWRPLVDWDLDDVIAIHHRHGLAPNPLYLAGETRVGCWPCIYTSKESLARVALLTPERIDEIAKLEVEIGRTFFNRAGGERAPVPIHDAVTWAFTNHGNSGTRGWRDLNAGEPGCVRWGLCEPQRDD